MAEYKRKNVKKLKAVKPKKSAVADNYKISSFSDSEQDFTEEIAVKSAKQAREERKTEKKKEKFLSKRQPEKRVVYSGKTAAELNSDSGALRMLNGTKGIKRAKRIIAALLGAVIIASVAVVQVTSPTGIADAVRTSIARSGSGSGFPLTVNGSTVYDMQRMGNCIAVLSDTYFELYNQKSKELFSEQHGFAAPKMAVSESRIIVYDQGSTGIIVYDASGKRYSRNAKNAILTAAVSRCGRFAVVTDPEKTVADITLYSKDNKKLFSYSSDSDLINSVAVSNNGNTVAALSLNAQKGEYTCKLNTFGGKEFKDINSLSIDALALSVDPLGNNDFAVSSSEKAFIYKTEDKSTASLSDTAVQYKQSNPEYGFGIVQGISGTGDENRLIITDNKEKVLFDSNVCASPVKADWNKKYVALARDYRIYVYDIETKKCIKTVNCGLSAEKFVLINSKLFVTANSTVTEYEIEESEK